MNKPTWKQVMKLMKELQVEYELTVFAASYKGSCSCCATPTNFNDEAYLTPEVKEQTWEDIGAYIVFKNSNNAQGEAALDKDFGDVEDNYERNGVTETKQYLGYVVTEQFTMDDLNQLLTRLVEGINGLSDAQYELTLPEDKYQCAVIKRVGK